jgi:hypothetical protein
LPLAEKIKTPEFKAKVAEYRAKLDAECPEPAPALAPSIASLLGPHCTEGDEETLAHTTKACREIDR